MGFLRWVKKPRKQTWRIRRLLFHRDEDPIWLLASFMQNVFTAAVSYKTLQQVIKDSQLIDYLVLWLSYNFINMKLYLFVPCRSIKVPFCVQAIQCILLFVKILLFGLKSHFNWKFFPPLNCAGTLKIKLLILNPAFICRLYTCAISDGCTILQRWISSRFQCSFTSWNFFWKNIQLNG